MQSHRKSCTGDQEVVSRQRVDSRRGRRRQKQQFHCPISPQWPATSSASKVRPSGDLKNRSRSDQRVHVLNIDGGQRLVERLDPDSKG